VPVYEIQCVKGRGIRGDRFFDYKQNYKGQITFFSMEVFDALRRELRLPDAQPQDTRRNVFLRGVDLKGLIGQIFEIQGIRFEAIEESKPCHWMNHALGPGAEDWLKGRGGLRCRILSDGWLRRDAAMDLSAVVLAGGQSRRMGRDKAWVEFNGKPLIVHAIEKLRQIGVAEIFISGRAGTDYQSLGCPVLLDPEPGLGPLAGIERALAACRSPRLLALAVDLPGMTAEFLKALADECGPDCGIVPELKGRLEPLAAIYPASCSALAPQCLNSTQRGAADFAKKCIQQGAMRILPVGESLAPQFANWNSPADITLCRDQSAADERCLTQ
jgi:molybdopterin-guanine dinucleotide biosynthesis protein A